MTSGLGGGSVRVHATFFSNLSIFLRSSEGKVVEEVVEVKQGQWRVEVGGAALCHFNTNPGPTSQKVCQPMVERNQHDKAPSTMSVMSQYLTFGASLKAVVRQSGGLRLHPFRTRTRFPVGGAKPRHCSLAPSLPSTTTPSVCSSTKPLRQLHSLVRPRHTHKHTLTQSRWG